MAGLVPVRALSCLHPRGKRNFCWCLALLLVVLTLSVSPVNLTAEKWTRRLRHGAPRRSHSLVVNGHRLVTRGAGSTITIPSCADPGAPENGVKRGTRYTVGSELVFACKERFLLIGSEALQCRYGGERNEHRWNTSLPQCVGGSCLQ